MLKVIVMLDCNICGRLYDGITSSEDRDPMNWKSLALDLEYKAEGSGWTLQRSAHYCDYCVTDVMIAESSFDATHGDSEAGEIPF